MEKRVLKGIAKRWEQQLKAEDSAEQEVPSFGSSPDPARAVEFYQAQSEAASSSGGHNNYAGFLSPQARLKRPLERPRAEREGTVYSRVWSKFQRELPLVATEVERTPGQSARRSYLCSEARRAVSATLGVRSVESEEKEESKNTDTSEGLEPNTKARRNQPGAVTVCAETTWEPTTRYSSSSSSCTTSSDSATTRHGSSPPTVGYNSEVATPTWYQHDTSRR